ncbi:unnamed protein product [Sympodiomycopsis kandeliae]
MSSSSGTNAAPRQEMIQSAISFLSDPKIQSSSIAQRIAFLESKGLNSAEIDEALRQSGLAGQPPQPVAPRGYPQQQQQQQQPYYGPYPPRSQVDGPPTRDWRDWFIMAVVTGTVGYGVIALARKYLFPHLQPPNQTILESDRDALTAKYDEVAAMLNQLDLEQKAIKTGLDEQRDNVDAELKKVEAALEEVRAGEKQRKEDMDRVRNEVETIEREMPKLFTSSSQATSSSLSDLQSELKSLRSLLTSRASLNNTTTQTNGATTNGVSSPYARYGSPVSKPNANGSGGSGSGSNSPPATSSSAPPPFGVGSSTGKPSIPAWQLADSGNNTSAEEPNGTSAAQAGKEHSTSSPTSSADEAEKEGYVV